VARPRAAFGAVLAAAVALAAAPRPTCASESAVAAQAAASAALPAALPPEIAELLEPPLQLGQGTLRWFGLRVYDARFVAPADFDAGQPWRTPFALELVYARPLKGADIARRSAEAMRTLDATDEATMQRWAAAMAAIFPDVSTGDRLLGAYLPGRGARFFQGGRPIGSIDEPAFARAFFSLWLDPRTPEPALRESLLRQSYGRGVTTTR